jgi:hypothetical protein
MVSREELDSLTAAPEEHTWCRVAIDARPSGRARKAPARGAKGGRSARKGGGEGADAKSPDPEGVD